MKAWMRRMQIILTSKALKKRMTFGLNEDNNGNDLNIQVTGTKYMSSLKDEFTVKITNLTYAQILELINGQYYDIEIKIGYKTSGLHTIFNGGVLYISNVFGDRKSNDVMIFCASKMIAQFGQRRMNLSLNSGINMYAAIKFITGRSGAAGNIDKDLRHKILSEVQSVKDTSASWLDTFCTKNNLVLNSDASYGNDFTVFNPYRKDARVIKIDPTNIILTSGYPTLTNEGLNLCIMPTFNFMCTDTIAIPNDIIDLGISDASEYKNNAGFYLDTSGKNGYGNYMIYKIVYSLENRGTDFSLKILAKARSLMSKVAGIAK